MKIDFEGRTWQLETGDVDMEQGLAITAYTGMTLVTWEQSLAADPEKDPESYGPAWLKSMRCLYWLMRAQNGEPVPLESANFAVMRFFAVWGQAAAAEAGDQVAEEDPTKPAGGSAAAEPSPPVPVALPG